MDDDKKITKKDTAIFVSGVFFAVLIISVSGFLFFYNTKSTVNSQQSTVVIATPVPQLTTKQEEADYKNTEIQVLNASGKAGLAKVYADKLKNLGYAKVTTGNYTETLTGNLLFAPTNFKDDLEKIGFANYKFQKSENVKIVISK